MMNIDTTIRSRSGHLDLMTRYAGCVPISKRGASTVGRICSQRGELLNPPWMVKYIEGLL